MKKISYKGETTRLDKYISSLLDITRSQAQKLITQGDILVNGKAEKSNKIVAEGDIIEIFERFQEEENFSSKKINVNIIYEDENIIVVDKETGVVVYPAPGHKTGTLLEALKDKIKIKGEERPGVVHRLDKDTSGLIVLAKNKKTETELKKIIKKREFEKIYITLVEGKVKPERGTIDIPIKRATKDRKKMEAAGLGRDSVTEYEVIKYYENLTLLRVKIITGRTHQIRVHFAGIGYPVVGDKVYGKASQGLKRQFLHAHQLGFKLYGKKYSFKSDIPDDLKVFLDKNKY